MIQPFGDRKTILVRFEGSRCPYLAYNVPRIRVADEDLVMDQDTYDSMIRKRDNVDYSWERRVSKYTIDDVNKDAFAEYLRKAKEAGRIDFEDTDVKTVLDKLELIEGNYLLNAGTALFSIVDRAMKLLFSKIELKSIIQVLFPQIKRRKVMWWEIKDQFVEIL